MVNIKEATNFEASWKSRDQNNLTEVKGMDVMDVMMLVRFQESLIDLRHIYMPKLSIFAHEFIEL